MPLPCPCGDCSQYNWKESSKTLAWTQAEAIPFCWKFNELGLETRCQGSTRDSWRALGIRGQRQGSHDPHRFFPWVRPT